MFEVQQTREFRDWFVGLSDPVVRTRIQERVDRLSLGHFGDAKPVGEGISELRIHISPGYRAYFIRREERLILLLCGGDKSSQRRDIAKARLLARDIEG